MKKDPSIKLNFMFDEQEEIPLLNVNIKLKPDKQKNNINLKTAGCGLLLKTYQSDIFNNWIKTEWISGENGISAIRSEERRVGKEC